MMRAQALTGFSAGARCEASARDGAARVPECSRARTSLFFVRVSVVDAFSPSCAQSATATGVDTR